MLKIADSPGRRTHQEAHLFSLRFSPILHLVQVRTNRRDPPGQIIHTYFPVGILASSPALLFFHHLNKSIISVTILRMSAFPVQNHIIKKIYIFYSQHLSPRTANNLRYICFRFCLENNILYPRIIYVIAFSL